MLTHFRSPQRERLSTHSSTSENQSYIQVSVTARGEGQGCVPHQHTVHSAWHSLCHRSTQMTQVRWHRRSCQDSRLRKHTHRCLQRTVNEGIGEIMMKANWACILRINQELHTSYVSFQVYTPQTNSTPWLWTPSWLLLLYMDLLNWRSIIIRNRDEMLCIYYAIKLHVHHHFYKNFVLLCKLFWSDELYPYTGMPFWDL